MIREMVKNRVDHAKRTDLLATVAEQIKQAIDATTGETPSFASPTFRYIYIYISNFTRNSQLASVRRELIQALTEMKEEATKQQLDLRPYHGESACSLFLFFCATGRPATDNEMIEYVVGRPTPQVFMAWVWPETSRKTRTSYKLARRNGCDRRAINYLCNAVLSQFLVEATLLPPSHTRTRTGHRQPVTGAGHKHVVVKQW